MNESSYRPLHRKMTAVIMLAACTPLLVVSGLMLQQFSRSYREKIDTHLGALVQKHSRRIDGFLNEHLNILRYVAASAHLDQLRDAAFLETRLLLLQQQFSGVFEDLGLIDETGRQIAYAGPLQLREADYSEAAWFKTAAANPAVISDVFLGLRGRPHFVAAVRLSHGDTFRILRATIDFDTFHTLVETLHVGDTGMAYILNRHGEFQTRPAESSPLQRNLYGALVGEDIPKHPEAGILKELEDSGRRVLFAGALLKGGDWLLVCQQDTADAYRDLNVVRNAALLLLFLGCAGIAATAWTVPRRLIGRIVAADGEIEIMNRQVVESGKLAAIGELAAGIAHEINNPVAIMMEKAGWVEDLLEEKGMTASTGYDELYDSLEEIKIQARRCKDITRDLLGFSRNTAPAPTSLQVNRLLSDIVAILRRRTKFSGVAFNLKLSDGLPEIKASASELQQVFLNLINNALDAMEKNGGNIGIRTAADGEAVLVEVSDSGPGIPESDLSRIFEPFFTTKPPGKGTGLGLSICYGIVRRLGGRIDVFSQIGSGATFRVRIPTGR